MKKKGFHETVGCLANFKVYPGRGNIMAMERRLHFQAYVFTNVRSMRAFAKKMHCGNDVEQAAAFVSPVDVIDYRKSEGGVRKPIIGYLFMAVGHLGSRVVMHECVHMAANYLRRTNVSALALDVAEPEDSDMENEEHLAYAAGECARQVVKGLYDWGVGCYK